ncbi:Aminotransferase class I/classII [Trinorchestia longiramus]|nr:Aminotransferase class I/classII [Trinorchestia longiramus]
MSNSQNELEELRNAVSNRAMRLGSEQDLLTKYASISMRNSYHETHNPKGIVNLGTSVNRLMESELQERLNRPDMFIFKTKDHQHYFDFRGTALLREALSGFFSRHFSGGKPVMPDQLVVMNGVTACMDNLAFACCDAGDIALTPTPVYGRIFTDFQERSAVKMMPVHLLPKKEAGTEKDFELAVEAVERRIEELEAKGKKVGAFVLLNPQNPLGDVYPPHLVMDLLKICAQHKIHVIIDEIYALSVHAEGVHFSSVLSYDDLPDPNRTHFVWGLAKDFGLAGMRIGVVYSRNPIILKCLDVGGIYQGVASILDDTVAELLNDTGEGITSRAKFDKKSLTFVGLIEAK